MKKREEVIEVDIVTEKKNWIFTKPDNISSV